MRDQSTAIHSAYCDSFDALASRASATGEKFGWRDVVSGTLLALRSREERISPLTVSAVLALLVTDGYLMAAESEVFFWRFGDVTLCGQAELLDAFDEVEVGDVVDRAFAADGSREVQL